MKTGMNRYSSASTDQMPSAQCAGGRATGPPPARRAPSSTARPARRFGDGHQIAASVRFCAPSSRA